MEEVRSQGGCRKEAKGPEEKRVTADYTVAEDSLNIALREITVTARDGRVSQLEQVYIRGSMVSLTSLPLHIYEMARPASHPLYRLAGKIKAEFVLIRSASLSSLTYWQMHPCELST